MWTQKEKSSKVPLVWLLNGDKREGKINGMHGEGGVTVTCYSECMGMAVVNAALDMCKPILRPHPSILKKSPCFESLSRPKSSSPRPSNVTS